MYFDNHLYSKSPPGEEVDQDAQGAGNKPTHAHDHHTVLWCQCHCNCTNRRHWNLKSSFSLVDSCLKLPWPIRGVGIGSMHHEAQQTCSTPRPIGRTSSPCNRMSNQARPRYDRNGTLTSIKNKHRQRLLPCPLSPVVALR